MDNKKTGKFIAQRRKEMNLTQKQLAEKLNVTDKAVSKWETGNGAPDISLLTALSNSLNVSVIELLDGEYSERTNPEVQSTKIVIEALREAKKARIKTTLSILAILVILFSLINIVAYGYWGKRHKVLYNVDTVFIHQNEENESKYDIYYNCSVKNWWFDFTNYNYNLKAELRGEPGTWHFGSEETNISSTNINENTFVIHVVFDKSTVNDPLPSFEELIKMSRFSAYNKNGESDYRANLYMEDFEDVKIIII